MRAVAIVALCCASLLSCVDDGAQAECVVRDNGECPSGCSPFPFLRYDIAHQCRETESTYLCLRGVPPGGSDSVECYSRPEDSDRFLYVDPEGLPIEIPTWGDCAGRGRTGAWCGEEGADGGVADGGVADGRVGDGGADGADAGQPRAGDAG